MQQLSYSGCQCSDIAAVCCDSRIVCWQEILSPSDIRWNARRAIGTGFSPWNARKALRGLERRRLLACSLALGTPGTPEGLLERAKRIWTARRALSGYSCKCVRWLRYERAMRVR